MEYILLDIGSSNIKPFLYRRKKLMPLTQKALRFKESFSNGDLSEQSKQELVDFITKLQTKYPSAKIKTYATSVFRDLSESARTTLIEKVFAETGVLLNIIDHPTENLYLQIALVGQYKTRKNVMLMAIGGGSTELIIVKNNLPIERHNIKVGVGTINLEFPEINNNLAGVDLDKIVKFVQDKLPRLQNKPNVALYSGGELNYMQITKHPLKKNTLFKDMNHPSQISFKEFAKMNHKTFEQTTLRELEKLMPDNPKWMHGARAGCALAHAIFDYYEINTIIPSNAGLIHGVVKYEYL